MEIFDWKSLTIEKFRMRHSFKISKTSYKIPLEYSKKHFIIQTPVYTIIKNPSKDLLICLPFYKSHSKFKEFIERILSIEVILYNSVLNKSFVNNNSIIRHSISLYNESAYFNTTIQHYNNLPVISIYDHNQDKRGMDYIIPQSNGISLIYLKNVWYSNGKVGFNWINLQCKIYKPFIEIDECLIMDEENIPHKRDTCYDKFIKMHKFGVPISAIKIELIKHDLHLDTFMNKINSSNKVLIEKKHTTPIGRPKINMNMLLSVKLKKGKKRKKRKKIDKILKGIDTKKYRPPTQNQLQDILAKLKKH